MELLGQGGVFVEQRQALVHPLLDYMEVCVHLQDTSIRVIHLRSELREERLSHLEFHLLGLLGVNGHDVLVMRERVSAVLLLYRHVTLQGLQHALRLQEEVGRRTDWARLNLSSRQGQRKKENHKNDAGLT